MTRSSIPTAAELRRSARRLDRCIASVNTALAAMRDGQSLHLQYQAGRSLWSLSDGRTVSAEVAAILINDAPAIPVGDALFADMPGQVWRYCDD